MNSILVISLLHRPNLGRRETRRLTTRQQALLADIVYRKRCIEYGILPYAFRCILSSHAHAIYAVSSDMTLKRCFTGSPDLSLADLWPPVTNAFNASLWC